MLKPIEDHVLVEPIEQESTTKSGIILPDSKEKPNKWKVIAVWAWQILENWGRSAMEVAEGDIVYFSA